MTAKQSRKNKQVLDRDREIFHLVKDKLDRLDVGVRVHKRSEIYSPEKGTWICELHTMSSPVVEIVCREHSAIKALKDAVYELSTVMDVCWDELTGEALRRATGKVSSPAKKISRL